MLGAQALADPPGLESPAVFGKEEVGGFAGARVGVRPARSTPPEVHRYLRYPGGGDLRYWLAPPEESCHQVVR